jgi:hypothetical protein
MKKLFMFPLLLWSFSSAHATPAPGPAAIHLKLGNYEGVDAYGQSCSVFFGAGMGDKYMSFFWLVNAQGSYNAGSGYDPQPTSPGKLEVSEELMADGYDDGRPYFRQFFGAPIGTYVISTTWRFALKGDSPTSLSFTAEPFEFLDQSVCKKLKYTGPYRH